MFIDPVYQTLYGACHYQLALKVYSAYTFLYPSYRLYILK
jgi:hypothetical protein